jgi:hypothetical protein
MDVEAAAREWLKWRPVTAEVPTRAPSVSDRGTGGMKRILLVIALALGLLAESALPAIADEHVGKRSNWSHDRTKVYTTTAVNQHNL